MKAATIHSYGHSDQIKIEDIPDPQLKAGEVRVKIHSAGVNPVDWKIREGYMKSVRPAHFPLTLGQDFAGEVVEVAEGVDHFEVGDRVFGFASGSYAEYASVKQSHLAKIPNGMNYDEAAALPTSGLTAYQLIVDNVQPEKGQTVLIHGAGGGVGSIAVQIAKSMGAIVLANATAKDEKYLKSLGADKVYDFKTQPFEEFVDEVDAVVDLVGGDTLERSYSLVKPGGIVISTVGPVHEQEEEGGVRVEQFVMNPDATELEMLGELAADGVIKVHISKALSLDDVKEAQDLSQTGRADGKIVMHVE